MCETVYVSVLKKLFDNIFEINLREKSMRCIVNNDSFFEIKTGNLRVLLDDAVQYIFSALVHPDDRKVMRNFFSKIYDDKVSSDELRTEIRILTKSRETIRYFCEIVKESKDKSWFCFNRINSAVYEDELLQRNREAQFEEELAGRDTVFSNADIGLIYIDFSEKTMFFHNTLKNYFLSDMTFEQMYDIKSIEHCVHPEDWQKFLDFYEELRLSEGEKIEKIITTVRLITKDNKVVWNRLIAAPYKIIDDDYEKLLVTVKNINKQVELEKSLETTSFFLNSIVNEADRPTVAFYFVKGQVRIRFINYSACRYFSTDPDKLFRSQLDNSLKSLSAANSLITEEQYRQLAEDGVLKVTAKDIDGKDKEVTLKCIKFDNTYFSTLEDDVYDPTAAIPTDKHVVSIRTFGYFDIFVDGQPILFKNEKAKELIALLVDRKGGFISSHEAITYLWDDEPVSALTLSRLRKVAMNMRNTLNTYGIGSIVEVVDGKRRIVPDLVDCDYFNYLSGDEKYAETFKGLYMLNYSWGEITLAGLV